MATISLAIVSSSSRRRRSTPLMRTHTTMDSIESTRTSSGQQTPSQVVVVALCKSIKNLWESHNRHRRDSSHHTPLTRSLRPPKQQAKFSSHPLAPSSPPPPPDSSRVEMRLAFLSTRATTHSLTRTTATIRRPTRTNRRTSGHQPHHLSRVRASQQLPMASPRKELRRPQWALQGLLAPPLRCQPVPTLSEHRVALPLGESLKCAADTGSFFCEVRSTSLPLRLLLTNWFSKLMSAGKATFVVAFAQTKLSKAS